MGQSRIVNLEMNRVEGDLELRLEFDGNRVTDAWTVGTMYRGFEQFLSGRADTDGLVITPRICGICGTAHQYVAVAALETAYGTPIAPNGMRVRNICLATESVQSDARHTFLMFCIDLCHQRYGDHPLFPQIVDAFAVFEGSIYTEVVRHTKELLKIVAHFGGQWPHATFMVPGGVVTVPDHSTVLKSLAVLDSYTRWYEERILGCSSERWEEVSSYDDLMTWLDENEKHRDSALGLFVRFTRDIGLHTFGRGSGNLLSYGSLYDPERWQPPFDELATLNASGFRDADTGEIHPVDHQYIAEHVKHSFFVDHEGGQHPWVGDTIPEYAPDTDKYSWAKAPRYHGKVAEAGPLADSYMAGDPLVRDLFAREGSNSWLRQFVRLHRPVATLAAVRKMLFELVENKSEPYIINTPLEGKGSGVGLGQAARGALAHWVQFEDHKIQRYQIITPTGWNASPRDSEGHRGHWEETVVGTTVRDVDDPIELGHIIRSHDACLVCTVHFLDTGKRRRFAV